MADALVGIDHPGYIRSAISRIYYAAFNKTVECQASWGFTFFYTGEDHKLVRERMYHCYNNELSLLRNKMRDLHNDRKRADYELNNTAIESEDNAKEIMAKAKSILATLDRYSMMPTNSTDIRNIISAIQTWEAANPRDVPV